MTLLELLIAMGLGTVVSIMALTAYMGANKAQAITVGTQMLTTSGQKSLADIYRKLNGARKIYDRPATAGATTDKFLLLLPIDNYGGGLSPGPTLGTPSDVLLPKAAPAGSFAIQKDNAGVITNNAAFDQTSAGNALFFLAKERRIAIHEAVAGVQTTALGTADYYIQPYRFHFYYLARRALPQSARPIRGTDTFTYQLMHWDSLPYLDRADLEAWMAGLMRATGGSAAAQSFIDTKLAGLAAKFPGAVDTAEDDPDTAMFRLTKASATDFTHLLAQPVGTQLVSGHFGKAIQSEMRTTFGESFVAFNTEPAPGVPLAGVPIRSLSDVDNNNRVPNYADATTGIPYGFEVMVAGPPQARKVLMHLTLAARTQPGNVLMAHAVQQVAQLYEY